MKKINPLKLIIISMAALVIPIAEAMVLDARSFGDLPIEAQVLLVISMTGLAILLYHYLVVPFWTWFKIWISGR